MILKEYIQKIDQQYRTGLATEHSYRPMLQQLLATLLPKLTVTNEAARIACGAPDLIITRKTDALPVAFLEAKNIDDTDLDGKRQHKEQFNRYRQSLDTIVFTDYLDFHLYEHGEFVLKVRIGETAGGRIRAVKENEAAFLALVDRLAQAHLQPIASASKLALQMAGKARLLADVIARSFDDGNFSYDNRQLRGQYEAFRRVLIHDITPAAFADIYAQTIAYGMFAARLHDPTPDTFSRQEAATLIPKTNPFLRQIFQSIAGYDLDPRIAWIVDDLAATFLATDVEKIMKGYAAHGLHTDPMIHFYEDFLSAYNPKLRKSKGVWYTPQPVVSFIVRAVDDILQRDFSLPMGLADYSTVEREVKNEQYEKGKRGEKPTVRRTFHKVQILDPATGTGTFLAEVVRNIFGKFRGIEGMWQGYVQDHLLPRLCGFELLMASYAIAHLKLDMLLSETGYHHDSDRRLRVYLTNSLEECHPDTGSLFAQWLSAEANEANRIKRDSPVMVMLGNPPYSVSSLNKGEWITHLVADYKKNLGERNIQPLSDDYIKFIRLGHYYIEKNGEGILAYISNNSFLDGLIHRQMRRALLETFSDIYILDLHGNSKRKEVAPDGSKDENVFDIMQGVSINLFVRRAGEATLLSPHGHRNATHADAGRQECRPSHARIHHCDLFGSRQSKYDFLENTSLAAVPWQKLQPQAPEYFFVPKDFSAKVDYEKGFAVNELFIGNAVGIVTSKDAVNVFDERKQVERMVDDLLALPEEAFRKNYNVGNDSRDWSIARAKADVIDAKENGTFRIIAYDYRPFDTKFLVYTGKTNGIVARPRYRSFRAMLHPANLALVTMRQISTAVWQHAFVSCTLSDKCSISTHTKEASYIFPLYIVGSADSIFSGENEEELVPNFQPAVLTKIEAVLGEKAKPQELFDYIYAVLHSPRYRERYREFLKIDFPRIPYPTDTARYHSLAKKGAALRRLHLMDGCDAWATGISYPVAGSGEVTALRYDDGRVYINDTQYFGGVSREAWNAYIGGYQPAQKWLKDRKGCALTFEDIRHYQQIVFALSETRRIMREIDETTA